MRRIGIAAVLGGAVAVCLAPVPSHATTLARLRRPLVWLLPAELTHPPGTRGGSPPALAAAVASWAKGQPQQAKAKLKRWLCPGESDATCSAVRKVEPHRARGLLLLAELHLDAGPEQALVIYRQLLAAAAADSDLHAIALYRAAIASHRCDRSAEAASLLDRLLRVPAPRNSMRARLRAPAMQLLGLVFGDYTWNGKEHIPELKAARRPPVVQLRRGKKTILMLQPEPFLNHQEAIENLRRFFAGRRDQALVRAVYREVLNVYVASDRHEGAMALISTMLARWPAAADGFVLWDLRVRLLEQQRQFAAAKRARDERRRRYPSAPAPAAAPVARLLPPQNLQQAVRRLAAPPWLSCARRVRWPGAPVASSARITVTLDRKGSPREVAHQADASWPGPFFACLERELRRARVTDEEPDGAVVHALLLLY